MNPVAWWNALTPSDQQWWKAQLKTLYLTANTCGACFIGYSAIAGAFTDNDHFLAWFGKTWIVTLLTVIWGGGTALAARQGDAVHPPAPPPSLPMSNPYAPKGP